MPDVEKLKKLLLSTGDKLFLEDMNSWKIKLVFWDIEQTKRLKDINEQLNVDKKQIEEEIEDNKDRIYDLERNIRSIEYDNSKLQDILDCL